MKDLFAVPQLDTRIPDSIDNRAKFHADTPEVTAPTFEKQVLESPLLTIVYFYKQESEPCKLFEEELYHIQGIFADRVLFFKANAGNSGKTTRSLNSKLVRTFRIDGIPVLLFFKNRTEIHRIKGIVMREKLQKIIEGTLLVEDNIPASPQNATTPEPV